MWPGVSPGGVLSAQTEPVECGSQGSLTSEVSPLAFILGRVSSPVVFPVAPWLSPQSLRSWVERAALILSAFSGHTVNANRRLRPLLSLFLFGAIVCK